MRHGSKISAICLATILFSSLAPAADITMEVSANRDSIFIGEAVILTVKVSGLDSPDIQPDLSGIANAKVRLAGNQSDSHYSIVIINGKMTRDGFSGRIFTYEITPAAEGSFKAGPIILRVNGRTLTSEGPTVQVTGIAKQEWVDINITSSRETVLVDEPFDITLAITLKRLPGQYAGTPPLDPNDPPTLTVPFLELAPITGLETPDIKALLNSHIVQRNDAPGFAINNYAARNDFGFGGLFNFGNMGQERKIKFMFDQQETERSGVPCFKYVLTQTYTPKDEGSHTFGPAIFKGNVVTGVNQAGQGLRTQVFAVGPATTVRVIPPPETGRPVSYIGAIGTNILVEAALDAQTCNVGDPLKLVLSFSGNTRLENINPPLLNAQTNLIKHFKIYEDSVQTTTKEGKKLFTYTVRPTTAGTLEFPAIEASYFDISSRSYKVAKTLPIPVRANEAQEIGAANIIETAPSRTNEFRQIVERDALVVAPIDMDPAGAEPVDTGLKPWERLVCILGPATYLLVAGSMTLRRRLRTGAGTRKRRQEVRNSLTALGQFETTSRLYPETAPAALCSALRKYIANRFGATEAGLTPSDARKLLTAGGIESAAANALCDILERHFNSAFSAGISGPMNIDEDARNALSLVTAIEKQFNTTPGKEGITRPSSAGLILLILSTVFCTATQGATAMTESLASTFSRNSMEFQFLWNEANSKMASALSPDEFVAAAGIYTRLNDAGVRNGPLFYNMGTALLKGKKYDEAIKAFLRAERYSGRNEDTRRNMLIAIKARDKTQEASLSWDRVPLFWHYGLPLPQRIAIAIIAFTGLWLALIIRSLGSTTLYKPLLSLSVIILVLFGSSAATSLHLEDRDIHTLRKFANGGKVLSETAPGTVHSTTNQFVGKLP